MELSTISISVDSDTARAFAAVPPQQRQKIELLLGLRLKELTTKPASSLEDIMNEMSREAEAKGLTPEILESILNDK
jgi:hypothetical protein